MAIITKIIRNKLMIFLKSKILFLQKLAHKKGKVVAKAQAA